MGVVLKFYILIALDTIEEDDESDPQEGLDDYDFDEVMKDEEADPYRPARKAILYFPKPVRKLKAFCLCRNIKKKKRRGDEPEEFEEYSSSDPSKRKRGKGKRKWRRRLMISKFILTFLRRWRALFNTRIKRHCYCTRRAKAIR